MPQGRPPPPRKEGNLLVWAVWLWQLEIGIAERQCSGEGEGSERGVWRSGSGVVTLWSSSSARLRPAHCRSQALGCCQQSAEGDVRSRKPPASRHRAPSRNLAPVGAVCRAERVISSPAAAGSTDTMPSVLRHGRCWRRWWRHGAPTLHSGGGGRGHRQHAHSGGGDCWRRHGARRAIRSTRRSPCVSRGCAGRQFILMKRGTRSNV